MWIKSEERQARMSAKYFIEGHRPKKSLEDEETLAIDREGYETLEDATIKAKDFFEKESDLGLAVIYKEHPDGTREGVKFIYKEEDGTFEDSPLYWGACDTVCEG